MRGGGIGRGEQLAPVVSADPQIGPRRLDAERVPRRPGQEGDRRLDHLVRVEALLQLGHAGVLLCDRARALGCEIAQGAQPHRVLAETRQHVLHIAEVLRVRTHEEHAAGAVRQPRLGVQEVRRPVQRDHRLPGAGPAVHHESAGGGGTNDGVLIRLDRRQHVPHPPGAVRLQAREERGLIVEGCRTVETLRRQGLVPVVRYPACVPSVPSPGDEPPGVLPGRREVRFGCRSPPVDQQTGAVRVGHPSAPDVHRRALRRGHSPEAHVDVEALPQAQGRTEPSDLEVAVDRRHTRVRGLPTDEGETSGQGVPLPGQRGAETPEVGTIDGDEGIRGFRRVVVGQGEGVEHRRSPSRERAGAHEPSILPREGGLVASPHPGDILEVQGDEGTSS